MRVPCSWEVLPAGTAQSSGRCLQEELSTQPPAQTRHPGLPFSRPPEEPRAAAGGASGPTLDGWPGSFMRLTTFSDSCGKDREETVTEPWGSEDTPHPHPEFLSRPLQDQLP